MNVANWLNVANVANWLNVANVANWLNVANEDYERGMYAAWVEALQGRPQKAYLFT